MTEETEPTPRFIISRLTVDDLDGATEMRLQSWHDTYTNDELGVTKEWIDAHIAEQTSPEANERRRNRVASGKFPGWVAKDGDGKIIGATTPYVEEDTGRQRVGSIYVDKQWHGKGIAGQLMQNVIDWADPTRPLYLEVISYNDRAQAFYKKWGFEKVPESEKLFKEVMPEFEMIRLGDKQ